jgi:hypothetical protein
MIRVLFGVLLASVIIGVPAWSVIDQKVRAGAERSRQIEKRCFVDGVYQPTDFCNEYFFGGEL